ncbi:hypothetical protein D7V80_09905 [Corallococcus sp. CA054B]|uniref:tetratricopeptide repeat protein n=1 Tax=Corallococcus sp. CA054B TaxID=2316734 RepID=UPI000EA1B8B1|nr:hypothetical protein [Corallococcus sp. CA054B]RKG69107.1 hypothetical protein D7V80_09905 [Corallococcus sp. CA054B]
MGPARQHADTSATQEQARQRAAELLPDSPSAQNSLAWYYVTTDQPQKGLAPAQRAVRLMPGNSAILDTQAALFFQTGRCREAVAMGRRALDMLHEGVPDAARQDFKRIVTVFETKCVPAPSAQSNQPQLTEGGMRQLHRVSCILTSRLESPGGPAPWPCSA